MSITINEFRVLQTLADCEQHDKAPKGLTDARSVLQYNCSNRKI